VNGNPRIRLIHTSMLPSAPHFALPGYCKCVASETSPASVTTPPLSPSPPRLVGIVFASYASYGPRERHYFIINCLVFSSTSIVRVRLPPLFPSSDKTRPHPAPPPVPQSPRIAQASSTDATSARRLETRCRRRAHRAGAPHFETMVWTPSLRGLLLLYIE
jgi:hypothetical protein